MTFCPQSARLGCLLVWVAIGSCLAAIRVSPETAQADTHSRSSWEPASANAQEELSEYLDNHGHSPEDYVVGSFRDHQIVLLGEIHEVRDTCELVAALIGRLDKAQVKRLCFEFLPSRLNARLQQLIVADEYQESAVAQLFRESAWPTWGYHEYMEIVRAVWQVNHDHQEGEAPFLIIGMDSDWKQVDLYEADAKTRFQTILDRENHMTKVIRETAQEDTKVLVHVGFAHTVQQGVRVAKQLGDVYGDELFQIVMHHRLTNSQGESPLTDAIESAVGASRFDQVGFTVTSSPFAALEDPKLPFARALAGDASLGALAEGYIFLQPVDKLKKVTWSPGFITEETFDSALIIARKNQWIEPSAQPITADELDGLLQRRFPHK